MEIVVTAIHHRTRERVRDLGEVFTPEAYIGEMMDLLGSKNDRIWSDESVVFFEPCCGHGNFVISILTRRMNALYEKACTQQLNSPEMWAVANAINTLWAIDIDTSNIFEARQRVFSETVAFINQNSRKSTWDLLIKHQDFFAHLICAIEWHISENETMSALSQPRDANANAKLTKAGDNWLTINGHHQLNFELPWAAYYLRSKASKTAPFRYKKANQHIKDVLSGRTCSTKEFTFAKDFFEKSLR